jgi:structural maintenance of chromosome 4
VPGLVDAIYDSPMADDIESGLPETPLVEEGPSQAIPRLTIQSLRLENFKSYGGVVDVGPFHKSFSSIVGPNGSGKSNVIDAMLFVFGRRAKQLRHGKLHELIHHSDSHPSAASATVTVFFEEIVDTGEGDNDYEVIPNSEFSVARRAFRNDTSKYFLDGKDVKMSTVVDLLKAKGVDLDNNRFLILQGEVELISMMKPKALNPNDEGLLEYLEDIIGSNRHVDLIAESAQQVECLNDERSHKLKLVKATERERDAFDDAKKEAEEYLDKERNFLNQKMRITRWRLSQRNKAVEEHRQTEMTASESFDLSRLSLKEAESKAKALQDLFETKKSHANKLSDRLNAAKENYAVSERADIQLGTELKALKAKLNKLQQNADRESARAGKELEHADAHSTSKDDAEKVVLELQQNLKDASCSLDQVRSRIHATSEPSRKLLDHKQAELLPFKAVVNQYQHDFDVLKSEHDMLLRALEEPTLALAGATESLAQVKSDLLAARAEQSVLLERRNACNTDGEKKRIELNSARANLNKATTDVSNLRRLLEETKQAKETQASSSKLIRSLYEATRTGRISGLVGRLGDLGSIDPKYGTAAGAAAGSYLDNMVVKTADDAQACIEYMREQNLGRATFIILEKLSYLTPKMTASKFDGPRLFDMVQVADETNRIAFYLALRDTLVANFLEEARRMAFKPTRLNRVVTLRGELIESSGAMTGGGSAPPRFRLGAKTSAPPIPEKSEQQSADSIERNLDNALRQGKELNEKISILETDCRNIAIMSEEIETNLVKSTNRVKSLEVQINEISFSMPKLKQLAAQATRLLTDKNSPDMMKIDSVRSRLRDAELALQSAKSACVDMESAIQELLSRLQELNSTDEIKSAAERVDKIEQDISHQRSIVSSSNSRMVAARKNSESAAASASKSLKSIEKVTQERNAVKAKRTELEGQAKELTDTFQALEKEHDIALNEVKRLAKEHSAVKAELKSLRHEELHHVEKVNEAHRIVVLCQNEIKDMRNSLRSLQRKLQESMKITLEGQQEQSELAGSNDGNEDGKEISDGSGAQPMTEQFSDRGHTDELTVASTLSTDLGAPEDELSPRAEKELEISIAVLEREMTSMKPNISAIAEYRRKNEDYKKQVCELDDLTNRRDFVRKENDTLRKARLDEFMHGYSVITLKLKEIYQMITLGGDAELELVDSLDPFSEGIVFSVRPPKKSWKNISNLSGGEKTLSSLALVFALHHFKPTPLYFMDEIDAALDFKNVGIVANYVKERTKNAQFIIISLRNNMFELADRLVGIYKTHNTTKSVTVNPRAFAVPAVSLPVA